VTPADELQELRERTVWDTIAAAAARFPARDALVAADDAGEVKHVSYARLVERVRDLSGGLADIGVRRGDRLVVWMTNTAEWVVCSFAAMRIGAVVVPVNTFLTAPEAEYFLTQSGARHAVLLDRFRTLQIPDLLAELCPAFTGAREPGFCNDARLPELRNVVVFHRSGETEHAGAFDLGSLEAAGRAPGARALADRMCAAVTGSDLGMVKYTSGSTGFPKGVMLEQGGIVANAVFHSRRVGISEDDVFFSMMPFFHGGGSIWGLMTMMVNAGTLVFTEAFDARLAARLIEEERPTISFGVLADEVVQSAIDDGRDLSSLRIAHLPNEDARRAMSNVTFGITPFGLTEAYGPAALVGPDDPPEKYPCGRPLDGNELRVVDHATGLDVEPGEVGEAWIRGNVMRGYWNKPEETARALDADGWLHTEDLVTMDADGYVRFTGRLKLMLKVGGENVSVEEVERVITDHDAVVLCGVVGVPDPRRTEVPRAYVALRPGKELTDDELRTWVGTRLARFKQPRDIVFVDELPKLDNGKLDRVALARRAETEVVDRDAADAVHQVPV
jgi:fatty-acyl-CoA synthase